MPTGPTGDGSGRKMLLYDVPVNPAYHDLGVVVEWYIQRQIRRDLREWVEPGQGERKGKLSEETSRFLVESSREYKQQGINKTKVFYDGYNYSHYAC